MKRETGVLRGTKEIFFPEKIDISFISEFVISFKNTHRTDRAIFPPPPPDVGIKVGQILFFLPLKKLNPLN